MYESGMRFLTLLFNYSFIYCGYTICEQCTFTLYGLIVYVCICNNCICVCIFYKQKALIRLLLTKIENILM
jgi:hypothetical protein